jgi:hypothetical protein
MQQFAILELTNRKPYGFATFPSDQPVAAPAVYKLCDGNSEQLRSFFR